MRCRTCGVDGVVETTLRAVAEELGIECPAGDQRLAAVCGVCKMRFRRKLERLHAEFEDLLRAGFSEEEADELMCRRLAGRMAE